MYLRRLRSWSLSDKSCSLPYFGTCELRTRLSWDKSCPLSNRSCSLPHGTCAELRLYFFEHFYFFCNRTNSVGLTQQTHIQLKHQFWSEGVVVAFFTPLKFAPGQLEEREDFGSDQGKGNLATFDRNSEEVVRTPTKPSLSFTALVSEFQNCCPYWVLIRQ